MSEGERGTRDEQEREEFAEHRPDPPHHDLSNPVRDPDETEWPDPYERREDPRDPEHPSPAPAAPSSSDPPPPRNVDAERRDHRGDTNDG